MLRWLVRKVVQYVLEEIEVRRPAQGAPGASPSTPWSRPLAEGQASAKDVDKAVMKETMQSLASAATRGPAVEMEGLRPGKAVVVDGGKSKDTVERLAGLGT